MKITWLSIFLIIPLVHSQKACHGEWGIWEPWSSCPLNPSSSLLNVQRRVRVCVPTPEGCNVEEPYDCPGSYSEVKQCLLTSPSTTISYDLTTTRIIPASSITRQESWPFDLKPPDLVPLHRGFPNLHDQPNMLPFPAISPMAQAIDGPSTLVFWFSTAGPVDTTEVPETKAPTTIKEVTPAPEDGTTEYKFHITTAIPQDTTPVEETTTAPTTTKKVKEPRGDTTILFWFSTANPVETTEVATTPPETTEKPDSTAIATTPAGTTVESTDNNSTPP